MRETIYLVIILFFGLNSFNLSGQENNSLSYDLNDPEEVFVLPDYLEEVSGLSFYKTNQLAMINDEHGRMYVFDIIERKVVHRVRFEGNGDFEGIERVGDYIYAIKSNGKLYRFNVNMTGVVEKIDTPFDSDNDVEGLGHDPHTNHLLVALKEDGDVKDVEVKGKAIYGFHLPSEKFKKIPLHIIQHNELKRVVGDKFKFKPSGVAVHPVTGEVYVLAAVQRSLLVFGTDGKPKHLSKLRGSIFPQPEGITFSPDGTLFICNEVEGEGGTVLMFKPINP